MTESLLELVGQFRAALVEFSPDVYSGEECAALVEALAAAEKACAAARVRAAARAGACGAHRERGFADASDWLARLAGSSAASAKAALQTVTALEELPDAKAAVERGELSMAQAHEIVKTEASCPGSATEMLGVASGESLRTLKEQARDRRLRVLDPEELHAAQHAAKEFRHWRTALGNVGFKGEVPPEVGLPFVNALDAETDRLWKRARRRAKAAEPEPAEAGGQPELETGAAGAGRRSALAADAFVQLVNTGGKARRDRRTW